MLIKNMNRFQTNSAEFLTNCSKKTFAFFDSSYSMAFIPFLLTHCRLNELPHTIYWKILIFIFGLSGCVIQIFLEKND